MSFSKKLKNKSWYAILLVIFWLILILTAYVPFYRGTGDLESMIVDAFTGVVINAIILIALWKIILYVLDKPKNPNKRNNATLQNNALNKGYKGKDSKQKEKLETGKNFISTMIVISLLVLVFAFYWYSYRPQQIRQDCYNESYGPEMNQSLYELTAKIRGITLSEYMKENESKSEFEYIKCIRAHGLE